MKWRTGSTFEHLDFLRTLISRGYFLFQNMLPLRALTQFEQSIAQTVLSDGTQNNWEYAAFLESSSGPLIEILTSMSPHFVALSSKVQQALDDKKPIIIHHNHLSQESLSSDDWHGLANGFSETFAHCADGTIYWGKVLQKNEVARILKGQPEIDAANAMFSVIFNHPNQNIAFHPYSSDISTFFRKEVFNRAMMIRGFVQYSVAWGSAAVSPYLSTAAPAGVTGAQWDSIINQAAESLALTF